MTTSPHPAGGREPAAPGAGRDHRGDRLRAAADLVIGKFVVPRFEQTYAERTAAIQGGIEKAEQAQAEAEAALEKYNAQLAEARTEAAKIREDAKTQGAQILAEHARAGAGRGGADPGRGARPSSRPSGPR